MTKAEEIARRYADGYITPAQLDGTGADSANSGRNYVALGVITQADAEAIKAGQARDSAEMAQALALLGVDIGG